MDVTPFTIRYSDGPSIDKPLKRMNAQTIPENNHKFLERLLFVIKSPPITPHKSTNIKLFINDIINLH